MRKLFLTFLALIVQLCAWAFDGDYYKYTISPSTGTANKKSGWLTSWISTEKVDGTLDANGLKLASNSANFQVSGDYYDMRSGTAQTSTYTLTPPAGYVIEEYTFTFANNGHNTGLSFTMSDGTVYTTSTTPRTLSATKQKLYSVSFVLAGTNGKGVVLTDFKVKIKEDKQEKPQVSTAEEQYWYYIASAATNTYCKDKVIYYDRETERMRFGEKSFSADRIWSFWEQNGKLAIKNYRGEYIGTAGPGTGGSTAFGIADG